VVVRPFRPATEPRDLNPVDKTRANRIVERVLGLDAATVSSQLEEVLENFVGRHRNLLQAFEAQAHEMERALVPHAAFTPEQRHLVGAYFLHEYSFEAAALFNPSIVLHPDQSGVPEGASRFILSLPAVGEGHVSSLTFRSGVVGPDGAIQVDPPARLASIPSVISTTPSEGGERIELAFSPEQDVSERVFYATYTAYTGRSIRSELLETRDFLSFRMSPLAGSAARNKGMALFPRKLNGRYAMVARQDNENLYLVYSDDLYTWNEGVPILKPQFPWEFVQIGNCGSPIELDEGWLLLTHGVGPVRRYAIGAALLDKADPSRVLARSREPLVRPEASDRAGYVPNVVYTCVVMRHHGRIVLPYAVSDTFCAFATMKIDALLETLRG